jgi:hypothetical protein
VKYRHVDAETTTPRTSQPESVELATGMHVQLRPGGLRTVRAALDERRPVGRVLRFPRPSSGTPPLATVEWDTGKTNVHDRRSLVVVERAP